MSDSNEDREDSESEFQAKAELRELQPTQRRTGGYSGVTKAEWDSLDCTEYLD